MSKAIEEVFKIEQQIMGKVRELESENRKDFERLEELETDYQAAVSNLDDKKADKLHDDMEKIRSAMNNRFKKVEILKKKDSPAVVAASEKAIYSIHAELQALQKDGEKKQKAAEEARRAFIQAVQEVDGISRQISGLVETFNEEKVYRAYAKTADENTLKDLKIHPKIGLMANYSVPGARAFDIPDMNRAITEEGSTVR